VTSLLPVAYIETKGSLLFTNINLIDQESPALLNRDVNYKLEPYKLRPTELFVGEKVLIYLHANDFDIFNTFWYVNYFIRFSNKKPWRNHNDFFISGLPLKVVKSVQISLVLVM